MAHPSVVSAQPAASTGPLAETLFRDGKALMTQGRYAEACPKLAESQRLDPGLGTLLALAYCHEKEGKTATAWSEFVTARGLAQRTKEIERERLALGYAEELEPKLARVTVRVHPEMEHVAGFELRQNGALLAAPTWGMASPVDPGEQVFEATAPGRQPWTVRFVVRDGDTRPVDVPVLARSAPAPIVVATPPLAAAPESHSGRSWGYAVGGLGIASIAVGSYFGLHAVGQNNDAKLLCAPANCMSSEGVDLNSQARTSATISTIAIAGGLVAVGIGTFLVLTSRSSSAPRPEAAFRLVPLSGPGEVGAGMRGVW
jgi:hypothetical protein